VLAGLDLMRSEVIQVIIPAESAQLTVSYIADLSLVQFKDVRPPPPNLASPVSGVRSAATSPRHCRSDHVVYRR
jgi:hypothetical protein